MSSSIKTTSGWLLERGHISEADLLQARKLQTEVGGFLEHALLRIGAISEDVLLAARGDVLDLPVIQMDDISHDETSYERAMSALGLPAKWFKSRNCVAWQDEDKSAIKLLARNILDQEIQEKIAASCKKSDLKCHSFLCSHQTLETAMIYVQSEEELSLQNSEASNDEAARLREMAEEAPVIDFVNRIFSVALKENASDIHIEPFENRFIVRYRIDGILHNKQTEPRSRFNAVASRVKLLSGMDIAERRLPQDGRQTIRFAGQDIDLRVSSVPGSRGESLVLRLLRKENELPDLEALGFEGFSRQTLLELLGSSNGIILVTGPTGSGKSTTLYRSLQGLNNGVRKIITIEDPVEYDMDGIIQIQTHASIGYTFAKGLRAILRQDPDIIMVGEIRDGETATIAAQAALTGHLVLSTLHTNSALAAIARLVDIGLEPYMITSAVRGLVAQRLVRKLCEHCSVSVKKPEGEDRIWAILDEGGNISDQMKGKTNWREPKGCSKCSDTGYQGRLAIFEVARMDDALSEAVLKNASLQQLHQVARKQGYITLLEDGIFKARNGVTSLTEVLRVCGTDTNNY